MTAAAKVQTRDVMAALQAKYAGKAGGSQWSGGLYLEECGINGGGAQTRCDALYAGFTSASGRKLIGHEVKVSRSDWLAELSKVGKADFWFDNTHQWYVVAPPNVVLWGEELPEEWGFMVLEGSRVRILKRAPVRDVTPSWTATRSMLSRMETLRAAAYVSGERDQMHRHQADQQRAQRESVRAPARGQVDLEYERYTQVKTLVTERLRRDSVFTAVDNDDLVEALVDLTKTKEAGRRMHNQLVTMAQDVDRTAARVADGIRDSFGPLAEIVKEARDGQA